MTNSKQVKGFSFPTKVQYFIYSSYSSKKADRFIADKPIVEKKNLFLLKMKEKPLVEIYFNRCFKK